MISKGINLTSLKDMSARYNIILDRLTSSDPRKKMPPGDL
jgi:hypothetical protein